MRRYVVRFGVLALVLAVVATPFGAQAQEVGKVYRIGVLSPEVPPPGLLEDFREGLSELGYVDGKNVSIELRHAGGRSERLAAMADELVRLRVHAILTINTPAAQAAKNATVVIPIVITRTSDPVRTGLVSSLAHPGGNITGLSFQPEESSGKRIELLKEALPRVTRVAALWYARNEGAAIVAREMEPGSTRLGVDVLKVPIEGPNDFVGAFEIVARRRAGALVVVDDAFVTRYRAQILELAAKHSLPVVSMFAPFVEGGGLMAYGPSIRDMYRRAAHYVDKILKGAKPADLPIEQPTRFELVINLKKARAMGLIIPQSLLIRADRIIE